MIRVEVVVDTVEEVKEVEQTNLVNMFNKVDIYCIEDDKTRFFVNGKED